MLNAYPDILIVTALQEECFIRDYVFNEEVPLAEGYRCNPGGKVLFGDQSVPLLRLTCPRGEELSIAWAHLNGMGNVWAYDQALRLMDKFCPRLVLMLGVAGGLQKSWEKGDVAFAQLIGYSSLSKIEDESLLGLMRRKSRRKDPSSRNRLIKQVKEGLASLGVGSRKRIFLKIIIRKPDPVIPSPNIVALAEQKASSSGVWIKNAKQWFVKAKSKFCTRYADYCDQEPPPTGVKSDHAVVASGESVVASPFFTRKVASQIKVVNQQAKKSEKASLFEMESFGVGMACKRRNIPFGIVKGVSDYAGKDKKKGSRNADSYRLAALASATAFVFDVLTDRSFRKQLPLPGQRCAWSRSACVWSPSNAPQICRNEGFLTGAQDELSEQRILLRDRPCVETEPVLGLPSENKVILGSRLVEQVTTFDYSDYIKHALDEANANLILLFPYSVRELLSFCDSSGSAKLRQLVKDFPGESRIELHEARNNRRDKAFGLGMEAFIEHTHFKRTNEVCVEMLLQGKKFAEIAQRICRIMCIPEKNLEGISEDPAFLMHITMCGLFVPTLLAKQSIIEEFRADEATYVLPKKETFEQAPGGRADDAACNQDQAVTMCLKYSDRSKLLTVLGWCGARPTGGRNSKILELADSVKEWLDGLRRGGRAQLTNDTRYRLFPVTRLLTRYGYQLDSLFQRFASNLPESHYSKALSYFNDVMEMEPNLEEIDLRRQ